MGVEEGTEVGAYRVLRRIGEGGMGAVWLVEHAMLGRRAALKLLHSEYSNNSEIVTRFFNEARAATAIPDPGIVQIFDFGRHTDGSAFIVMELLDGEPLDRRLARHGALDLPEALRIMRQVAGALGAAHARGIVHRDLKPENIFVVRDPEVPGGERAKILDFGIAKLVGEQGGARTRTQAVMGTPAYMSPEQCRGAGQVDARSDVYALGCVLFALLVGRPPFDAEGIGEIIAMHLREPPPVPSSLRAGIPPKVDRLVLRCLAKDPAQRFEHGADLADALGNLIAAASSQSGAIGSSAAYTVGSASTTLSAAAGARSTKLGGHGRVAAIAGPSVVAIGGVIAIVVAGGDSDPASPETAPLTAPSTEESAQPPAPESMANPPPPAPPPPAPPLAKPDPGAEVRSCIQEVLARFVAWARDHRGAPCPEVAALGGAPPDPWGRAFRLTCTAQPADQIVGVSSAGPDGAPGTADDIASWRLDREVTEPVRGARWGATATSAAVKPAEAKPVEAKLEPAAAKPAVPKPAAVKPAPPQPKQETQRTKIELDEFGLPMKR